MLMINILIVITAVSLTYFNTIYSIVWQRLTIVLLLLIIPIQWETCILDDTYLFNGLLYINNKLNLVNGLISIIGIILLNISTYNNYFFANSKERIIFTLCAITGSIILNMSSNMLTLLLGLELQSYSAYILAASYRNYEPSEAAGLKYFLLGALSSSLVFMGLGILYSYNGSLDIETTFIINTLSDEYIVLPYIGIILVLTGLFWKIAAAPLQAWSIDVYDAVPTRTTAFLSLLPKIAIISILIRYNSIILSSITIYSSTIFYIFIIISVLSLIIGSIFGLVQSRIKRLLAYSSVLNIGFILLGISLSTQTSDSLSYSSIIYLLQYILTTLTIWLCLINYNTRDSSFKEITLISQLQGVYGTNSILTVCFTILIFSVAGIPPMIGFLAKYYIITQTILSGYISVALIAIITSIISTVYYLNILKTVWSIAPLNTIYSFDSLINGNSKSDNTLYIVFLTAIITCSLLQTNVLNILISL